ncbi:MAG TPA: DUF1552 domain-containing protein [Bryobacteraceae bacterium]|nr:DUF1552 domain-containing protein [Bryobacteraceae bacterium]
MYLSKKYIPRRSFLRGVGVTLALPLLDSMIPAQTPLAKTAATPKTRFTAIFSPHGWSPTYWADNRPDIAPTEGRNVGLGFIHQPLAPWREKLTIVSGLDATSSMSPPGSSGGDHSRASAVFTGATPKKTAGADIYCGASVDQIIAQKYGQDTLLPSIQLAIEDPGANTGICGWGYSCAYSNSISWASPNKPLPHEINPQIVFEHLYGDGSTPEERLARKQASGSILDAVTRKVTRLQKMLPASDRARLNDYLDSVRELERRLQIAAKASNEVPNEEIPFGVPESFDEHVKLHFDLQALAFQGDITRVSSLMYARDVSLRAYPESGVKTPNHPSSHHGEDPKRREDWAKINQYHMKCFAYFLKKLEATPDGDGNLLDHSLIVWGSNMGNANKHSHVNVGYLMAGGASGNHKPKQLNIHEAGPTSNILLSTLRLMGVEKDSIGDSTRALAI